VNKDPNEVADILVDVADKLRCGRMSCINFIVNELLDPNRAGDTVKFVGSGRRRLILEIKEEN